LGRYTFYTTATEKEGDENVVRVVWLGKRKEYILACLVQR